MDRRRSFTLGLAAILFAGIGVGWQSLVLSVGAPVPVAVAVRAPVTPGPHALRFSSAPIVSTGQVPPVALAVRSSPLDLSVDASALVAEAAELQLLAQGSDLVLEPHQWEAMAAVTLEIQAVRLAYEATIATGAVLGTGRYRVEIPVYAAAGDALRARLRAGLCDRLGDAEAEEIFTRLGARLEGRFGGFGVSVQTLDITGHPEQANPDWVLTRTVRFWNSMEGQDRLTMRRETFLPGLEDPRGENWGPLLSVVAQPGKAETGS